MKKIFLLIILGMHFSFAQSQDVEQVSKKENKYIYEGSIKLFLGDKIFVESEEVEGPLKKFKIVNTMVDSAKTMSIEFSYTNFGYAKSTVLKITNPFNNVLHYKAAIKYSGKDKFYKTSIVPVIPRIFSMETWPEKLESIILFDFSSSKE